MKNVINFKNSLGENSMKIGIIGVGMLGEAVALNLLNLGYDVSVFNRTKQKTVEVEKKGCKSNRFTKNNGRKCRINNNHSEGMQMP